MLMNKPILFFVLIGLLVGTIIYSSILQSRNQDLAQRLQEAEINAVAIPESNNDACNELEKQYQYLQKQYKELEKDYSGLHYRIERSSNMTEEDIALVEQAELIAVFWQEAYSSKPGPLQTLRDFRNEDELRLWLSQDGTDSNEYVTNLFDCDDFSRMLQARAYEDGYAISIALVTQGDGDWHFINGCFIGNKFYYIDPQKDRIWMRCQID
jgi:hypothetical protein